jgi:hypothetical protein
MPNLSTTQFLLFLRSRLEDKYFCSFTSSDLQFRKYIFFHTYHIYPNTKCTFFQNICIKNWIHIIFQNFIWVARNASAKMKLQAWQHCLGELYHLLGRKTSKHPSFFSAGWGGEVYILLVVVNHCNAVLAIYIILSCAIYSFATGFLPLD